MEFRGGVSDPYFEKAAVEVFDGDDRKHEGTIVSLDSKAAPFKVVRVELTKKTDAIKPGDIGGWKFRGIGAEPTIQDGLLHTPACDDLAAVAAALSALTL